MHVLENYDHILRKHFTDAFIGTSKHVQNDLICCIAKLVTSEIISELNAANFVAIELDETPDISKHEQLSLVLRYVYNFQVFERFVEFVDCSVERSAEEIARLPGRR